ncbi:putative beta-D-xylosidase 7 [Abeliophyllum distichum]|uniref:Beta-D-xylosidase 7 n=1 Tax=Abeliophyllum distichum TaxID=126358 RepID=A0ABD1SSY1_9LAMI
MKTLHIINVNALNVVHNDPLTYLIDDVLNPKQPLPPFSCDSTNPSTNSFPFCNTSLPISQRVQDLVACFTLDEKISQHVNKASAVSLLGIPYYQWWSEDLHGVAVAVGVENGVMFNESIQAASSFPQVILTAATFNANLWYRIAKRHRVENSGYIPVSAIGLEFCSKAKFSAIVGVKNQGKMAGKHPVLLFLRQEKAGSGSPIKQLVGFQIVRLNPKAKANVDIQVNPCEHFSRANEDGLLVIEKGIQLLVVGDRRIFY